MSDRAKTEQEDVSPNRNYLIYSLGIFTALIHIYFNVTGTISSLHFSSLHFALFAILTCLLHPTVKSVHSPYYKYGKYLDFLLIVVSVLSVIYLYLAVDAIYERETVLTSFDAVVALIAIIIALELTRRGTGWIIPCIIIFFISYVIWWGSYLSGTFNFPGLSTEVFLFRSFYAGDGLFGKIARISSTYVFMFILFGAFLVRSGAGDFIIDLAKAIAGRTIGGPAFVAVIGSGLTGTISGSAVANTVSTGVITIPLMKRSGFPGKFAAGVEAAASTGGQLMPPIMGAGAFVMANYTQISYLTIVSVAFLPALMYFLSVAFYVRIKAKKESLKPDMEKTLSAKEVFLKGGFSFLIPILVLVSLLIAGFTPTYCAGYAILAVVASSWLTKNPMRFGDILDALNLGAKNMATTAILMITVGLLVFAVETTGIGNSFSLMINSWADGHLFIAIILVACAALVLGMGLPVTAAYIVLGTFSAPALAEMIAQNYFIDQLVTGTVSDAAKMTIMLLNAELYSQLAGPIPYETAQQITVQLRDAGVLSQVIDLSVNKSLLTAALLSAHMIIFWLSQTSNVTPPICLAAFAAASIAKTPTLSTGFSAFKISKGLYIIPFLFAYTPILSGNWYEALIVFGFSTLGIYTIIASLEGFMENKLNIFYRALTLVTAAMLFWPNAIWINILGMMALVTIFVLNLKYSKTDIEVA